MRSNPKSVIRTAVCPVAGRGTRCLPATKASPKEMLPVVDKPLIQYAVEEALAAGATRLVFITGASKRAIEDHFDSDQELEHLLEAQGKSDLLNQLRSVLPSYASCIYIRQPAPLGLGHAVLCAQPAVGAEPFFVHLADDLIRSVAAAYDWPDFRSHVRKAIDVDKATWPRLVGTYTYGNARSFSIRVENDHLGIAFSPTSTERLYAQSASQWFTLSDDATFVFDDASGSTAVAGRIEVGGDTLPFHRVSAKP